LLNVLKNLKVTNTCGDKNFIIQNLLFSYMQQNLFFSKKNFRAPNELQLFVANEAIPVLGKC
jgi:hypothetical protein